MEKIGGTTTATADKSYPTVPADKWKVAFQKYFNASNSIRGNWNLHQMSQLETPSNNEYISYTANIRFSCGKCGHAWMSPQGTATFCFNCEFVGSASVGSLYFTLHTQSCSLCDSNAFVAAMWSQDQIERVVQTVFRQVCQHYYGDTCSIRETGNDQVTHQNTFQSGTSEGARLPDTSLNEVQVATHEERAKALSDELDRKIARLREIVAVLQKKVDVLEEKVAVKMAKRKREHDEEMKRQRSELTTKTETADGEGSCVHLEVSDGNNAVALERQPIREEQSVQSSDVLDKIQVQDSEMQRFKEKMEEMQKKWQLEEEQQSKKERDVVMSRLRQWLQREDLPEEDITVPTLQAHLPCGCERCAALLCLLSVERMLDARRHGTIVIGNWVCSECLALGEPCMAQFSGFVDE